MIGGNIEVVFMFDDRLSVLVRGTGCEGKDRLVIDLPLDAALKGVARGDSIWWQGNIALWTPRTGTVQDVHIPRMGYSYSVDYLWPRVAALCRAGVCPECANPETMHDREGALWCGRCGASLNMSEVQL